MRIIASIMVLCGAFAPLADAEEQKPAGDCGISVTVTAGRITKDGEVPLDIAVENISKSDVLYLVSDGYDAVRIYALDKKGNRTLIYPEPAAPHRPKTSVQEAAEREIIRRYSQRIKPGEKYPSGRTLPARIFSEEAVAFVVSVSTGPTAKQKCESFSEPFLLPHAPRLDGPLEALRVELDAAPGWGYRPVKNAGTASEQLMNVIVKFKGLKEADVRRFVDAYLDRTEAGWRAIDKTHPTDAAMVAWGKVYVLNRYYFNVPESDKLANIRRFGGWGIAQDRKSDSSIMLFPLEKKEGELALTGRSVSYTGPPYRGLDEFDFFSKTYELRFPEK